MTSQTALSVIALNEDRVAPGLLGFLVVAALGVATWFLIKSMNKQLKKIDFDESETESRGEQDGARNMANGERLGPSTAGLPRSASDGQRDGARDTADDER